MGLRSTLYKFIFGEEPKTKIEDYGYFQTLSGYAPVYTSHDGGIYEIGLCRACIHAKASESSKARPALTKPSRRINYIVSKQPNQFMTATQFYYRLRTIYEIENNAFIVPIEKYIDGKTIVTGLYPVAYSQAEMKEYDNKLFVLYTFGSGEQKAIEYERVGHLRKHQYKDDFFGEGNNAFNNTCDLIEAQEQGSKSAIESGASLRFIGKLNSQVTGQKDLQAQQKFIGDTNLNGNNKTGVFLYDSRFESMTPYDKKPVLLDAEQKKAIDNNAYTYWGINEDILQRKYNEDEWNAFYESELEPFFIQVGEVLTKMFYTDTQIMNGNEIILTSDRLQYASNSTKINVAIQYFDRGLITTNQALDILNMPPIEGGDVRYIRAEYINPTNEETPKEEVKKEPEKEPKEEGEKT